MPITFTPIAATFDAANDATAAGLPLSIGAPQEFVAEFATDVAVGSGIAALAGTLYASLDLFVPQGSPLPPFSQPGAPTFSWQIDGTEAANTPYALNYTGNAAQRNGAMGFEIDDTGANFVIRFAGWYTLLEDLAGSTAPQNPRRLLYAATTEGLPLTLSQPSVYLNNRAWRLTLRHFVPPSTWTGATLLPLRNSRWYDRDILNNPPAEFSVPAFDLLINSIPATGIGSVDATEVQFEAQTTLPGVTPIYAWAYLIRTDTANNSIDWFDNYAGAFAELQTTPAGVLALPAPYDSRITGAPAIIGPAEALQQLSPGVVTASFTIDSTYIIAGASYRIAMICWWDTGAGIDSYSFLSDEYPTIDTAGACPMPPEGRLIDYRTVHPNHLVNAAPYERIRAEIDWNAGPFEACRPTQSAQVTASQMRVLIYEEVGTTRHVLAEYVGTKQTPTLIQSSDGKLVATWNGSAQQWRAALDFRIRWEANQPNLYDIDTTTNTQGPATSNQDWGGRTVWVEWTFVLENPPIAPLDEYVYRQRIDVTTVDGCFTWELLDSAGNTLRDWCNDAGQVQICVSGCAGLAATDRLIFAAVPADYPLARLREFDPDTGELPQLGQGPIIQADATWDAEGRACFRVDAEQVQELVQYRFVVIQKPFIPEPAEPCIECAVYVGVPLSPYFLELLADCFLYDMRDNYLT